jgi:hypothetical protein
VYDPLRQSFRLTCAASQRRVEAPLSEFRTIERLPGAQHPAAYRITYRCRACRDVHVALVSERDLDCEPVAPREPPLFVNLMTGRQEPVDAELLDRAERELRRGSWPWLFYCACEHDVRPGYPSHVRMIAPSDDSRLLGVAVACSACGQTSVNLVSRRNLDQPFFHDPVLRYVDETVDALVETFDRFRRELWSSRFDEERNRFTA